MMGVNSSPRFGSDTPNSLSSCSPAAPKRKMRPDESCPTTPRPDPTGLLGQVVFQLPRGAEFPNSINNLWVYALNACAACS